MAGIVNLAQCAVQSLSVGLNFDCDVKRDRVMGLIIAPRGFEVPLASLDSWEEILEYFQNSALGGTTAGTPPVLTSLPMVYPLTHPLFGAVDNTEEPTPITSGYGNVYGYADNPKQFQLELDNYGVQWWKQMQGVNGGRWSVYIIDKTFIEGQLTSTGWAGFDATLYADKPRYDGVNGTRHYLNVALTNTLAMGTMSDIVQFPYEGYDISKELNGNVALELIVFQTSAAIVEAEYFVQIGVRVVTASGRKNMLSGNLAIPFGEIDSWSAALGDGTAATVTAVAANGEFGEAFITVKVPDNYPSAQGVVLSTAAPAVLAAQGIGTSTMGGYQSKPVRVTDFPPYQ